MTEWWTYRLSSFLMFSPQVYYRLFETHNRTWWPSQWLALAAGVAIALLLLRRSPAAGQAVAALLAGAWLFVAWAFLAQGYADIHLAADYFVAAFTLQAGLLVWFGVIRRELVFERGAIARSGLVMFGYALVFWPLLTVVFERSWWHAEVFALAPDPTAVATLAVLVVCNRPPWLLVPIPLLWCLFSGATLWSMNAPDALLAPAVALLALGLVVARRVLVRRARHAERAVP